MVAGALKMPYLTKRGRSGKRREVEVLAAGTRPLITRRRHKVFMGCGISRRLLPHPHGARCDVDTQPSGRGASDAADAESAPEGGARSEEAGAS